jgi:hypothetical protein
VGDSGSILSPLSLSCATAVINFPFTALYDLQASLEGHTRPRRHAGLNAVDRSTVSSIYVPQDDDNHCWAATLEAARKFLHLPLVSQDKMVDILADQIETQCKRQPPAFPSMNQIAYTIDYMDSHYDTSNPVHPYYCTMAECIIDSLTRQRPIIMLRNGGPLPGHAVLLVGVDYDSGVAQGKPIVILRTLYIVDPKRKKKATVDVISLYDACRADAFISY